VHDINARFLSGFVEYKEANLLDESSLSVSVVGMPGTSDLAFTDCDAWFDMMETFLDFSFCQDGVTGSGNEGIEPTATSQETGVRPIGGTDLHEPSNVS